MRPWLVIAVLASLSCAPPPLPRSPPPPDCGLGLEIRLVRRGQPAGGAPAVLHLAQAGTVRARMVVSSEPPRDRGAEFVGEVTLTFDGLRVSGEVAFAPRGRGAAWPASLPAPLPVEVGLGGVVSVPVPGAAGTEARVRLGRLRPCADACWSRRCLPTVE